MWPISMMEIQTMWSHDCNHKAAQQQGSDVTLLQTFEPMVAQLLTDSSVPIG